jgi:hypothetical protein
MFKIQKYIKLNNPKVKIPAPKMADEVANRRQMILGSQRISEIINEF